MKRLGLATFLSVLSVAFLFAVPVFAGTGGIRIDPPLPDGSETPAVFEVWVQGGAIANDPHIFLVMTESSFMGLTGDVEVSWDGGSITIPEAAWTSETDNSKKVPPGTSSGAGYTVASLKDHLDTDGPIYWVFADLWDDPLDSTKKTLTVTLPSTNPEMLVYILGKSTGSTEFDAVFDIRVPPTIPGFVVPEIPFGTLTALLMMAAALSVVARSRVPKI